MPVNPPKTPCSVPGCRGWATRGSKPPKCVAHDGRSGRRAAKRNVRTEGFYSPILDKSELADLVACADNLTLDDEIACTRVILRRLMAQIPRMETDGGAAPLDPAVYARLVGLALDAARVVARLLRDKRALGGDAADALAGVVGQALDDLATEWGIEL